MYVQYIVENSSYLSGAEEGVRCVNQATTATAINAYNRLYLISICVRLCFVASQVFDFPCVLLRTQMFGFWLRTLRYFLKHKENQPLSEVDVIR